MKKDVLFKLPAEALNGARNVYVLGDFNNWKSTDGYELKIQADGSANVTVTLEAGKSYKYRFLVNGEKWVNDYHAERYERDSKYQIDNCIVTVPAVEVKSHSEAQAKSATPAKKAKAAPVAKKVSARSADKKVAKAADSKPKPEAVSKTRTKKSTSAKKSEVPKA